MPQYRKLYVKSTESLDINDMPDDFTRLMWILLPLGLCREGRGIDNPAWIKSKIFPLREDVSQEQIEQAMEWFAERAMLERYEVEGRKYFRIRSWKTYQGNTSKEAPSNFPPPSRPIPELVQSKSGVSKTKPAADRSASASASASAFESESESVNASEFESEFESATEFDRIAPDKILCDASGLSYFPADQMEWVEVIIRLAEDHGIEKTTNAMKQAFDAWIKTKTQNGRPYRKTNLGWINWAQETLAGGELPSQGKKRLTAEEKREQERQEFLEKTQDL